MRTMTKTKKRKAVAGRSKGKARLNGGSMARAVLSAVGAPPTVAAPVPGVAPSMLVTPALPAPAADPLTFTFKAERIVNGLPVINMKPGMRKLWLTDGDVTKLEEADRTLGKGGPIVPRNGDEYLGFLSPEGVYYCNPRGYSHSSTSVLICAKLGLFMGPYNDGEMTLMDEGMGWIKFACYVKVTANTVYWRVKPTAAQVKVMTNWFLKNNVLPPDFNQRQNF